MDAMTSPLVTFLLAQLDADQAAAEDAETACWHIDYCDDRGEPFHDRFTSARIFAEVAAKRRIIDRHEAAEQYRTVDEWDAENNGRIGAPWQTMLDLAALYADRPGYDESWKP